MGAGDDSPRRPSCPPPRWRDLANIEETFPMETVVHNTPTGKIITARGTQLQIEQWSNARLEEAADIGRFNRFKRYRIDFAASEGTTAGTWITKATYTRVCARLGGCTNPARSSDAYCCADCRTASIPAGTSRIRMASQSIIQTTANIPRWLKQWRDATRRG